MDDIPLQVAGEETIARGVCHPFHFNRSGNKLSWNAFRPPPGERDVSVMRHDYIGVDVCRIKAKELAGDDGSKVYKGLAFVRVSAVRTAGADVVDSRIVYLGHADIQHAPPVPERGEPPDSEAFEALRKTCKEIAENSKYVADPDPGAEAWTGGANPL
jgi:hypothetical protein